MTTYKKPKTVAKHTCKYIDHTVDAGNGKDKGPQVICRLQVLDGPRAGDFLMWYGSLKESSQEYTAKGLRALGMTNDDIMNPIGLGTRKAKAVERENLFPGAKNKTRIDFIDPIEAPKLMSANPVTNPSSMTSKFKALFKSTPALEMHPSVAAPAEVTSVPEQQSAAAEDTIDSPF